MPVTPPPSDVMPSQTSPSSFTPARTSPSAFTPAQTSPSATVPVYIFSASIYVAAGTSVDSYAQRLSTTLGLTSSANLHIVLWDPSAGRVSFFIDGQDTTVAYQLLALTPSRADRLYGLSGLTYVRSDSWSTRAPPSPPSPSSTSTWDEVRPYAMTALGIIAILGGLAFWMHRRRQMQEQLQVQQQQIQDNGMLMVPMYSGPPVHRGVMMGSPTAPLPAASANPILDTRPYGSAAYTQPPASSTVGGCSATPL
jgi:hypothetical protein